MTYQLIANTFYIGTTNSGDKFLFDKDDFPKVAQYSWSKSGYYFMAYDKQLKKNVYLHRLVMGVNEKECDYQKNVVHHINHQPSDNRKKNLQFVSTQINLRFTKLSKRNTSGITGVTFNTTRK